MSSPTEIIDIVKRQVWLAFNDIGRDLIDDIKSTAVKNYMISNGGKPQTLLSIKSAIRSNALMNSLITNSGNDKEIIVSTVISGKEGQILAFHDNPSEKSWIPTIQQWRAIFKSIKSFGYYDPNYQRNKNGDGKVHIPGRPFIAPAIKDVIKRADLIVKKRLQEKFNGKLFSGKPIIME